MSVFHRGSAESSEPGNTSVSSENHLSLFTASLPCLRLFCFCEDLSSLSLSIRFGRYLFLFTSCTGLQEASSVQAGDCALKDVTDTRVQQLSHQRRQSKLIIIRFQSDRPVRVDFLLNNCLYFMQTAAAAGCEVDHRSAQLC